MSLPYAAVAAWSILVNAARPLLRAATLNSTRLRSQLVGRVPSRDSLKRWSAERDQHRRCVVFFCSSAGEYEQAKPLIERLRRDHADVMPFLVLFSASGARFARARAESTSWTLAPWDTLGQWRRLLSAIRPNAFVVVRYELWPAFLYEASRRGPLFLINATRSATSKSSTLARALRSRMLRSFRHLFAVGPLDRDFARDALGVPDTRVSVVGDTKYDRVRERALSRHDEVTRLRELLDTRLTKGPRLIVGSAWPMDAACALDAYVSERPRLGAWKLIIAPHDIGPMMIESMERQCADRGLRSARLSTWTASSSPGESDPTHIDVLIADTMGMLSELYGTADAAMVGGALHFRVHNVLEPACHGLPIAYGPLYTTSPEATHFADRQLATITRDAVELARWWTNLAESDVSSKRQAILAEVDTLCGASDRVLPSIIAAVESGDATERPT